MKKQFMVSGEVTIAVHTIVEAEDATQARERAMTRGIKSLCWRCDSSHGDDEEWCPGGGLDGEVTITHVDERE